MKTFLEGSVDRIIYRDHMANRGSFIYFRLSCTQSASPGAEFLKGFCPDCRSFRWVESAIYRTREFLNWALLSAGTRKRCEYFVAGLSFYDVDGMNFW